MMKSLYNFRRVLSLSAVVSLALMLTSCHYYKEEKDDTHQEEDLIANIEGYGIDTIAVEPGDTLCSARVDEVLRHYPEFYHAAQKAKKAYDEWRQLEAEARLGTKTQVMSVDAILNDALYGPDNVAEVGEWPDMAPIDSAYFKLIGQSGLKRKSAIGHARRAWLSYQDRLQKMAQTVPEQCRARYIASITTRVQQLMCEPGADEN
ncbi:MAG: hypothetical protein IJK41_07570 [Muribaculaceae bacterium]|nr:hypothetical protein [Muribaculaceae bacterium]